jgi:sugar phosphate isomerase/epimerase
MKLSIWTDAFVELEAEQAVERFAAIGWTTLELAEIHWRRIEERDDPERHFRELRRRADDLGLAFAQIHGFSFDFCSSEADLAAGLERAKRSVGFAAILGVGQYVFHTSSRPWGEEPGVYDAVRERNRDVVGQLADTASSLGLGIAVENTWDHPGPWRRFGTTVGELLWLAEQTDPATVGVCWDTGHAHIAGLDQYRAIKALGPHLRAMHIQDNDGSGDQHRLPYEGTIDWPALLRALREIGYQGAFNLEVGGALHATPLAIRPAKVRYALELAAAMVQGDV